MLLWKIQTPVTNVAGVFYEVQWMYVVAISCTMNNLARNSSVR